MDHHELRRRFATLTTAHLADACIRARIPVRCAPAAVHAVVPGSRLVGRVAPARHVGSVDIFLEAFERAAPGDVQVGPDDLVLGDDDGVLLVPAARAGELCSLAETIRDTERRQAERIRSGTSLRSQVRFDDYLAQRQQDPALTFRDHLRAVGGAIEE